MAKTESISGVISLLYEDDDPYGGPVILLSLDTDEMLAFNTFEVRGEPAARLTGSLEEGMRVRVDCRPETIEVVSLDTGETSDGTRPVVIDVVPL